MISATPTSTQKKPPKSVEECRLKDVVAGPAIDRDGNAILHDNGTPIAITALSAGGVMLAHLTMEQLRPVFTIWGFSGPTGKKEHLLHKVGVLAELKRGIKQGPELTFVSRRSTKIATGVKLLNHCFSDEFRVAFGKMNDKKEQKELDKGDAGGIKRLFLDISEAYNLSNMECRDNFPEDEHMSLVELNLQPFVSITSRASLS
jgi:hypothetical protein